ncbi:MAG TPA: hypothetical protein VFI44_04925 [Ornithinibacter sp.]|nr:hypothetical protein [Ornithinibacter sp.]
MGRRPLLAMALGWVLVVVAVAAVTFVVVDRAGRGVGQASAARTVAALPSGAASPSPSSTPATTPPARSSSPTPAPTRTPAPAPPRTSRPPAPARTPAARPALTRTSSFTTDGGTVVVSCDKAVLTLESITPRDGWRFEDKSDDGELEVKFRTREEDVDDVEITIGCVRGTPTQLED